MFLSHVCRKKHLWGFCFCSKSPLKAIQHHWILLTQENLSMGVVIIVLLILLGNIKNAGFVFSPIAPFAMVSKYLNTHSAFHISVSKMSQGLQWSCFSMKPFTSMHFGVSPYSSHAFWPGSSASAVMLPRTRQNLQCFKSLSIPLKR